MSSKIIRCKYPRIIRHPNAWQFVLNGFDYVLYPNGRKWKFTDADKQRFAENGKIEHPALNIYVCHRLKEPRKSPTLPLTYSRKPDNWHEIKHLYYPLYNISEEEALKYSLLNENTGEVKPLFLVVKCSQCELCVSAKKQSLSDRLLLESQNHDNPPMFVRLSFDAQHYPQNDHDLQEHTRPIQLFHKRLRKYFQKAGMNTDFKYFVTSEYGSKRGRLHYHALYYNLHNLNYVPIPNKHEDKNRLPMIYRFTDILRKTWQNGFVEVEVARDLSARYALKYMQKDYNNKTKQLKSIRLGKPVVDKNSEFLRENPDVTQFTILTKDGTYRDIPVYGFIANMVYPNVCKSVPKEMRDCFYRVSGFINYNLSDPNIYPLDKQILEIHKAQFNDYFKLFGYESLCPTVKTFETSQGYSWSRYFEDIEVLRTANLDLCKIWKLNYLREKHNAFVLMHNFQNYDIPFEVAKLNVQITKQLNKERDEE